MKSPKKVAVGPRTYGIVVDATAIALRSAESQETLDGICDHNTQTITVRASLAPDAEACTIIHEVLHAIFETYGLTRLLGDSEEDLTRALEAPLLALLRDNPRLISYLVGD